jgi:hypothetical protein
MSDGAAIGIHRAGKDIPKEDHTRLHSTFVVHGSRYPERSLPANPQECAQRGRTDARLTGAGNATQAPGRPAPSPQVGIVFAWQQLLPLNHWSRRQSRGGSKRRTPAAAAGEAGATVAGVAGARPSSSRLNGPIPGAPVWGVRTLPPYPRSQRGRRADPSPSGLARSPTPSRERTCWRSIGVPHAGLYCSAPP